MSVRQRIGNRTAGSPDTRMVRNVTMATGGPITEVAHKRRASQAGSRSKRES